MVKNQNYNAALDEHKKQKKREINKNKRKQHAHSNNNNTEQRDSASQRHRHADSNTGASHVSKRFHQLINDTRQLGLKSVFFDPEFNPLGVAPPGFKNHYYPLKFQHEYDDEENQQAAGIPLPKDPVPKYFKFYTKKVQNNDEPGEAAAPVASSSSYEAEENINKQISSTAFVPTSLLVRKRQRQQQQKQLRPKQDSNANSNAKKVRLETVEDEF